MKVSVIIPTLNEDDCIGQTLQEIPKDIVGEVVVIDGNSTDNTCEVVRSLGFNVYLQRGTGYGGAFIEAIPYVRGDIVILMDADGSHNPGDIRKIVEAYIKEEQKSKLFSPATYKKFMTKITNDKLEVLYLIYRLKRQGKKIAAIGAATKGNTLLNFYKLDRGILEFVTDSSRYKIGKYTPGSCIPIVHDNKLSSEHIDVGLIIPWNIGRYLAAKIKNINKKIRFIVPGEKNLL